MSNEPPPFPPSRNNERDNNERGDYGEKNRFDRSSRYDEPTGNEFVDSGMIPLKNKPALVGYYLGIASLLPILGILFAPFAFVLGIMGLRKFKQNPHVKGHVHAWLGIIFGGVVGLINLGCSLLYGAMMFDMFK